MNRKKLILVILTLLVLLACVPACQAGNPPNPSNPPQTAEQEHTGEQAAPEASSDIRSESPSKGETMIYAHIGEKTLVIRPDRRFGLLYRLMASFADKKGMSQLDVIDFQVA